MAEEQLILPIIDSHIHIYPASELDSLAWCTPDHPLAAQHSVAEYKEATKTAPSLLGFIFIEADRKFDLGFRGIGWQGPFEEIEWVKRVALGQPKEGEGHTAEDAKLCLAIVLWAPVPSGVDAMELFLSRAEVVAGEAWPKVKGFRYLLQDKPHGTMLKYDFIESVRFLGRRGYVFEIGVDQHRRGKKQLDELIDFVDRVHDGVPEDEQVTLVLNHLLKPDLTVYNLASDPSFIAWRTTMYTLSKDPKVYMKLSGGLSEMPDSLKNRPANDIFESILGWLSVVIATFGPGRIMFGSDWPVCTVGVEDAWPRWRSVVERMCYMASLTDEDRAMIFGGTAKKAYQL